MTTYVIVAIIMIIVIVSYILFVNTSINHNSAYIEIDDNYWNGTKYQTDILSKTKVPFIYDKLFKQEEAYISDGGDRLLKMTNISTPIWYNEYTVEPAPYAEYGLVIKWVVPEIFTIIKNIEGMLDVPANEYTKEGLRIAYSPSSKSLFVEPLSGLKNG